MSQGPDRGFRSSNSFAASGLDAINLSNGNLVMNIPIASLPAGRGTSPGYSISLQYNSKLWDSYSETRDDGFPDEQGHTVYRYNTLGLSDSGGWRFFAAYNLRITDRRNFQTPNVCWMSDPVEKLNYRWKMEVEMPDGSIKQFYPTNQYGQAFGVYEDGYSNIDSNGILYTAQKLTHPVTGLCYTNETSDPNYITSGMHYITMDGSNLRLFVPRYSSNWKLYFPDGSVVENTPPDNSAVSQRLTDRNGNYIEHVGGKIIDQVGRYIEFGTDSVGPFVAVNGVGGAPIKTHIIYGSRWIHQHYVSSTDLNAQTIYRTATAFASIQTIDKIIFPSQLGVQEMEFEYWADASQPGPNDETVGWGELKTVELPTEALSEYEYFQDNTIGGETPENVLARYASNKDLSYEEVYDGQTTPRSDEWLYSVSKWGSGVTSPNGSSSNEDFIYDQNISYWWDQGLTHRSTNPDGSRTERLWAHNIPFSYTGAFPQIQVSAGSVASNIGSANAFVKTEFHTIPDSSGNINNWLTAIKDLKHDKNGNVLEILEYDFVQYGTVPKSNGRVTGLPSSGLTLRRKTVNTYYNQAANADSSSPNGNEYSNPFAPKLRHLIKSSEIRDGNDVVRSRTEYFYDGGLSNPDKGNLTETRVWDSTKGSVSTPLTTGNSISTFADHDQYGNVIETKDFNANITRITYGDISGPNGNVTGLYPTQTTVAHGTSLARTSAATYDFYTGLVTTATDVDNNVTNATVYDALGRPVIAKSAVGTTLEAWTQTEYDDINRRVIVRSDLEAKEDGRKVATQFFDQLGRVRLAKTLEDAATQSATNETDGIKVQTRYKTVSGYTYQLTSNPYRAATSTAETDATMGWTLSTAWNHGRRSEVQTFSGAGLPTAFGGSNTSSTGIVQTEIDANATTVTDQAGKQRRSVTNALGQLIRVDEPDGQGNLGSVTAPNQPTHYTYNTLGKMVKVNQGVQNRYFMHDSLGRLLRVRQPEQTVNTALNTSGNPDNNSWTIGFTYDNNGNLLTSRDANNVVITSTYDALNRQLSRSYSDSTPGVTYTYDESQVPFSKGKLTKVASSVSESRYTEFDVAGRLKQFQQITDGQTYTSKYIYNLSGALIEEEYPSGRIVKNEFDQNGDLARIFGNATPSVSEKTYATGFSYFTDGRIEKLKLGNGLWESAKINSRLQVTELALGYSVGNGVLMKLNYEYGELETNGTVDLTKNTGNIAKQSLTFNGLANPFVQTFKYDPLYRLTEAKETSNGNQTWRQNFGYDRYGNRTTHEKFIGTTQLTLDETVQPEIDNTTNRFVGGQGFTFDANGNLVVDAQGRQFTFNGDNKQTLVRDDQNNEIGEYFYDGEGRRIKKVVPLTGETTIFVYSAGKLIAEYSTETPPQNPTTSYTVTDQLGSPRVIVDALGQVVSRRDFMPFGEEVDVDGTYRTTNQKYGQSDSVRQRFTGYQKDDETGLDFAEARMYQNLHGRFTAVDPLLASGKSADPQTFNRYVYVMNNPLMYTDPTGLQAGTRDDLQDNCKVNCIGTVDKATNTAHGSSGPLIDLTVTVTPDSQELVETTPAALGTSITYQVAVPCPNRNCGGFDPGITPVPMGGMVNKGIGALLNRIAAYFGFGKAVPQFANGITREILEKAATSPGPTIRVVTNLTQAPQAGRALSVAMGEGAEGLAASARSGGRIFTADLPKALVENMKTAGLVEERITMMGTAKGTELYFKPDATEFIVRFFQ